MCGCPVFVGLITPMTIFETPGDSFAAFTAGIAASMTVVWLRVTLEPFRRPFGVLWATEILRRFHSNGSFVLRVAPGITLHGRDGVLGGRRHAALSRWRPTGAISSLEDRLSYHRTVTIRAVAWGQPEAMKRYPLRIALFLFVSAAGAEEWTRFRGPNGSGVSNDTGFPTEFGQDKNLVWRTAVRPGKSSPVLTHNRIFLTAFENGKLFTQCFDRETGKLLWERSVARPRAESTEALNHPAAITAVTDGENVYSFFMDYGLISYDPEGNMRWKVPLGPFSNSMGHSSSPIIADDSIILVIDQTLDSYIAAFDRRNGKILWKMPRKEIDGWATPLVYQIADAAALVLTASSGQLGAHRVDNGKRVWSRTILSPLIVASPILEKDTLFTFGYGFD